MAEGTRNDPPYKAVLTHGYVVDGDGRKMSKSIGNVIAPQELIDKYGAEIVRLWVSSVDTSTDVPCDDAILNHVGDAYRKIRNTFRFLLGEIEDQFDPATQGMPVDKLTPYDRITLAHMCEVHDAVARAYEGYRFNAVFRTLYDYVTELSNGYLNATKDRVYCGATNSPERRSAQTTWAHILSMLVHDLQPILVYTTDEAMPHLPASMRDGQERAALLDWYEAPMTAAEYGPLLKAHKALAEARGAFTKAYEEAASQGVIPEKTSQAASAALTMPPDALAELAATGIDLAEPLVCSSVTVTHAEGERCPRCWNWRELGEDGLCGRCHDALEEASRQG